MLAFAARTQRKHIPHLRTSFLLQRCRKYTNSPKQYKVILDGGTLYVEQGVAEALGWTQDTPIDGVSLRLSGWGPHYFAITQEDTDSDNLARGTVESSRNPLVQETLEHLKKNDSE